MTGSISSLFSLLSWLIAWTPCLSESLWNPVPASFHRNLLRGILATCLKFEEKFGETIVRKVDEMGKIRILPHASRFFLLGGFAGRLHGSGKLRSLLWGYPSNAQTGNRATLLEPSVVLYPKQTLNDGRRVAFVASSGKVGAMQPGNRLRR